MKKHCNVAVLLLLASTVAASAQEPAAAPPAGAPAAAPVAAAAPQSLEERASYIIGFNMASNLRKQEVPVNVEVLIQGLREGIAGTPSALTPEQTQATMTEFQQLMMQKQQARQAAAGEKNQREADEFLAANKGKAGIVTTASGLQYQVVQEGTGASPKATDTVTVHYKGTLLDGTVFDSSYDRGEPATFGVSQVIPGWTEALQLMKAGSKLKLFIPPALAYGANGAGDRIGPNALLLFEVELLTIGAGEQPSVPPSE